MIHLMQNLIIMFTYRTYPAEFFLRGTLEGLGDEEAD
jgi:hypothetical protein